MNNKLLLLFLSLQLAFYANGQIKKAKVIDNIFSKWNAGNIPGAALGVMKEGELIYAKGYGMANLEYDIPNSSNSVFRIGSTSKQFTAACIIHLEEQGKLALDNTLQEYFTDFPAYAKDITIRHLLHHTSGIRDYLTLAYLKGYTDNHYYQDSDIMQWLVNQQGLNFNPGDAYSYSNSGYWLLGQVVQKVSGMNMAEYAEKEIFQPLGMSNTHFHNDHTQIVKNRASGYAPSEDGSFKISMTTLDMIGDGGIFTTINDIKKWDDAFYTSDHFSQQFWDKMTKTGTLNNGEPIDYAAGLVIGTYKGLKTISHGGAFAGFRADLIRFPEERVTIAIFANRGDANPTAMGYQVADIVLQDKLKSEEKVDPPAEPVDDDVPTDAFEMSQLVGKYEVQPGIAVSFSIKGDALHAFQGWNGAEYPIERVSGNTFQIPADPSIKFTFSNLYEGFAQLLTVDQGGKKSTHKRMEEPGASSVSLQDFAGDYYSQELDAVYRFFVEGDKLRLVIRNHDPVDLDDLKEDHFTYRVNVFRFKRSNGTVSGFELDAGGLKNLGFSKK